MTYALSIAIKIIDLGWPWTAVRSKFHGFLRLQGDSPGGDTFVRYLGSQHSRMLTLSRATVCV